MGDVDRASVAVPRRWASGMDRPGAGHAEHHRLVVQLASVRFRAGVDLRARCRCRRRHGLEAAHGAMSTIARMALPARPRILVIALRRLGDVLLTTPLIRSLRRAWPDASIDALVFADTAAILDGNPDLNGVVAMPVKPAAGESLALAARLWRR